jgi:hypothetical protein
VATEPIWRQIMLSTRATITGSASVRSRRPRAWKWATCASVAGWINSVSRSATTGSGGATGGRLLRSRWIARVCRTELRFLAAGLEGGVSLIPQLSGMRHARALDRPRSSLNLGRMVLAK